MGEDVASAWAWDMWIPASGSSCEAQTISVPTTVSWPKVASFGPGQRCHPLLPVGQRHRECRYFTLQKARDTGISERTVQRRCLRRRRGRRRRPVIDAMLPGLTDPPYKMRTLPAGSGP